MIYTIKQTKKDGFLKKTIIYICVAIFWIFIWEIASRVVSRDNSLMLLLFPSPKTVFEKLFEMAPTLNFVNTVLYSVFRVFRGFVFGVFLGFILGILTHFFKIFYYMFSPVLKMIRAVPVVAISILLFLFLETESIPIIIVILMVTPLVWQTVHDGLDNTDKKLLEMATVYKLSNAKVFLSIKLPSITPSLISACVNALGLAWKSGIAAEVICRPKISLGAMITQSKQLIGYDEIYAYTIAIIILSLLFEYLLKFLCKKIIVKLGGSVND